MGILPLRGLRLQEVAQGRAVGGAGLLPVILDRVPTLAQPLLIRIAILRNDSGDPLGVGQCQAQTNRCAVIEYVDRESFQPDLFSESPNDPCEVFKGVLEIASRRRIRKPKTRQ